MQGKARREAGEAARERASSKFRREALLPVWEAYYARILSKK